MNITITQAIDAQHQEQISMQVLNKLYDLAISGNHQLSLSGNLYCTKGKMSKAQYLMQQFNNDASNPDNLIIDIATSGRYIDFEDPLIESVLLQNNIGDSDGITIAQANAVTGTFPMTYFQNNTNITKFNEFQYFSYSNMNYQYWNKGCFSGCSSLQEITLPNTITDIPEFSFMYCTSLTEVNNFKGSQILTSTFNGCSSLTTINLSNVTRVGQGAFSGCSSLDLQANGLDFTKMTTFAASSSHNDAFRQCIAGNIELPLLSGNIGGSFRYTDFVSLKNTPYITSYSGYAAGFIPSWSDSPRLDTLDFSAATLVTQMSRGFCRNCPMLRIIKFPSTITQIDGTQFFYYTQDYQSPNFGNLKAIVVNSVNPPTIVSEATRDGDPYLADLDSFVNLKIYVPNNSVTDYETAVGWRHFAGKIYSLNQFAIDFPND